MNFIKFKNTKDKIDLKRNYSKDYIYQFMKILSRIVNIYQIEKPVLEGIGFGYDMDDEIVFILKDKNVETSKYYVIIDPLENKVVVENILGKNYDCFFCFEETFSKTRSGFRNPNSGFILEKIYYKEGKRYALMMIDEEIHHKYNYQYSLGNLQFLITLVVPEKFLFHEDRFLNTLAALEGEIKDIEDFYPLIKSLLKTKNFSLGVKNLKTSELIDIREGNLVTYIKNKKSDNLNYTLHYKNGELYLQQQVLEPDKNPDISQVKRKIK